MQNWTNKQNGKSDGDRHPDVAIESITTTLAGALDWVGMKAIESPVLLKETDGTLVRSAALVDAFVSLDQPEARGIHMSRLFKEAQDQFVSTPLSFALLGEILAQFLTSHEGLSNRAKIAVHYEALLSRPSLKSGNSGWRTYPVILSGELSRGQTAKFYLETIVTYSSTCPASAALSRQLIQDNFKNHFRGQDLDFMQVYEWLGSPRGINATPHAQRSTARIKVEVVTADFAVSQLIDQIENALQTPVQAMVKREDEQEFALRNGQNLMFCEDAARRIRAALTDDKTIADFIAEVRHIESLHPHDAVSFVSAGKALKNF
jgi:GTP cyclohydrolase I